MKNIIISPYVYYGLTPAYHKSFLCGHKIIQRDKSNTIGSAKEISKAWETLNSICEVYNITKEQLMSEDKHSPLPDIRRVCAIELNKKGFNSFKIAECLGYKERSSISYLLSTGRAWLEGNSKNDNFKKFYNIYVAAMQCKIFSEPYTLEDEKAGRNNNHRTTQHPAQTETSWPS